MAHAQFPEPKDLSLSVKDLISDGKNIMVHEQFTLDNPHPGFGKDPNIINYLGHTKYPRWVKNKIGESVIANNADEEAAILATEVKLNEEGPTVEEWVKAGYKAIDYPPAGYASRSTKEEIDAAIKAASGWK